MSRLAASPAATERGTTVTLGFLIVEPFELWVWFGWFFWTSSIQFEFVSLPWVKTIKSENDQHAHLRPFFPRTSGCTL